MAEAERLATNVNSIAASPGASTSGRALADINQKLEEMRRRARPCYLMAALGLPSLIASPFDFNFPKVRDAVMAIAAVVPPSPRPPP